MSKKTKAVTIVTPSLLAFSRCIEPTDGFFYQKDSMPNGLLPKIDYTVPYNSSLLEPVAISSRKLRTTMSNRQKPAILKDPEKMNAEVIKANLQETEICYLRRDCDTLVARTSIKIIPFSGTPTVCNNSEFSEKLQSITDLYIKTHGFNELAKRYASNIANGRWLWRNRIGAQNIAITVECVLDGVAETLTFDSKSIPIADFSSTDTDLAKLTGLIAAALRGENFLTLYVTAEAVIGYGHQVFPSEEMNVDEDKRSKELFQTDGVAGLHSVKVGNALRTIDTWYKLGSDVMPISIETFGSVTNMGMAFRQPVDNHDFYTLFDNWMEKDIEPSVDNQHYVMAMLIRGGVFGKSSK